VPQPIAAIALQNKEINVLFRAAGETLRKTLRAIAADPEHLGAVIGFFTMLGGTWNAMGAAPSRWLS
jgi:hypothetical protein